MMKDGKNIGLITDAGTPGISDPGEEEVKQAIKENIEIIPIPGACALINALIASGLNTKEFAFYGFFPLDKKLRNAKMEDIQKQNKTIIFYEAPHRLEKTLAELLDRFGNIEIVIAKELTKIHESFIRGRIEDILPTLKDVKGEYIILFEMHSKTEKQIEIETLNQMTLEEQYKYYENQGMNKKDIIKRIAKNNKVPKDEIYKKEMYVTDINLLLFDEIKEKMKVNVKTRYSSKEETATIQMIDNNTMKVEFENPVARITPGQSAVFYLEDIVVGGGKIV